MTVEKSSNLLAGLVRLLLHTLPPDLLQRLILRHQRNLPLHTADLHTVLTDPGRTAVIILTDEQPSGMNRTNILPVGPPADEKARSFVLLLNRVVVIEEIAVLRRNENRFRLPDNLVFDVKAVLRDLAVHPDDLADAKAAQAALRTLKRTHVYSYDLYAGEILMYHSGSLRIFITGSCRYHRRSYRCSHCG